MKKFLLLTFVVVFASVVNTSWAQDRTLSGTVTPVEDGSTLPGVNVILKGTSNGTVTDINGAYRLTVPADGGTLVFSFVGLQTIEGTRADQTFELSSVHRALRNSFAQVLEAFERAMRLSLFDNRVHRLLADISNTGERVSHRIAIVSLFDCELGFG